jgi:periplasmic divalent cation tolerance protein
MSDMILVYVDCSSVEEAKKIATSLLKEKLCACTNIIPGVQSLYLWPPKSGKIESANEVILLIKTVKKNYQKIEKQIKKLHSYSVPAIFSIPIETVEKKYRDWMKKEV